MNKASFIKALTEKEIIKDRKLNNAEAERAANAVIDIISDALAEEGEFSIVGAFGLNVKERKNPAGKIKTHGKTVKYEASVKKRIVASTGKALSERLNAEKPKSKKK